MRRLSTFLAMLILSAAASLPARADFVKDYRGWQQLGPDGQAAYAMAIFDVMTVVTAGDLFTAARAAGLRSCALSLKLKGHMVAQAITKFYTDHPDAQIVTPFIAFNGYLERGACSPFINQQRELMGLPPMSAGPKTKSQTP